METYKGFELNQQGDPQPNGNRENQAFHDVIDTIVTDCIQNIKRIGGHLHNKLYDNNSQAVIRSDNLTNLITIGLLNSLGSKLNLHIREGDSNAFSITKGNTGEVIEQINDLDHTWEVNKSSVFQLLIKLLNDNSESFSLKLSNDTIMNIDTIEDSISIGRATGGFRPFEVKIPGNNTIGNILLSKEVKVNGGIINLRGTPGSPDNSEILFNAYYDGSNYRRVEGGNAFQIVVFGGTINFFTASGDGPGTTISWGSPIFSSGSNSVALGNSIRLYTYDVVSMSGLPEGATQAAAGANANELWVTNGHASLPDGVVMRGF